MSGELPDLRFSVKMLGAIEFLPYLPPCYRAYVRDNHEFGGSLHLS
jgi:hypothetical protein